MDDYQKENSKDSKFPTIAKKSRNYLGISQYKYL